ncbi:MAG TPA: glycoside hydrolase family 71/99-like protein, partial [Micromonosporaceae bacterium]
MAVSRRRFMASALSGAALAAVGGSELISAFTSAASAASPVGDVVGKITVGYQGWFACIGDGSPINAWWHWSSNWSQPPSPSNNGTLRAWPDMSDYTARYTTAYANNGNGAPPTLFSHYDQSTVNAHFASMQANNIDTAALQRFNPTGGEGPVRNAVTARVRTAAETYGRKFYIMYDVTGWTTMQSDIKADWTNLMSTYTSSTAYAKQNGKPVVGVWGFGFNDTNHPWDAATCLDVIQWFQSQGCYVMGGVPREWLTGVGGSRSGFLGTYHAFNMISPWMVGAIGTPADSDGVYTQFTVPDQADCATHGIDYQPCVLPGDLSARQRLHGDFMWRQFYNMCRAGVAGIYISMFDE